MPVLSLQDVTKTYGRRPVLENVDLALESGQVTAIVGRSGCGKSTLLKLFNGLVVPDRGRVSAFGAELDYADLVGKTSFSRRRLRAGKSRRWLNGLASCSSLRAFPLSSSPSTPTSSVAGSSSAWACAGP
jgi:energy-coupling factor transporter ATP-binding protein EcfA2